VCSIHTTTGDGVVTCVVWRGRC